MLITGLVTIN